MIWTNILSIKQYLNRCTSSGCGRCARLLDVVKAEASVAGVSWGHGSFHGVGVDVDGEGLGVTWKLSTKHFNNATSAVDGATSHHSAIYFLQNKTSSSKAKTNTVRLDSQGVPLHRDKGFV